MIRLIKIDGGLLNHIRPEYLLSYSDYLAWVKSVAKEKFEFVPESSMRLSVSKYNYSNNFILIVSFLGWMDHSFLLDFEGLLFGEDFEQDAETGGRNSCRESVPSRVLYGRIESDFAGRRSTAVVVRGVL
jgi:hypothetical protein